MQHSVRLDLFKRYSTSLPHSPRLERPLESYSAVELEQWVMRRASADSGWFSDRIMPARNRIIKQHTVVEAISLIEGGRWLLTVLQGGRVIAHDLNPTNIIQKPLLEPYSELDTRTTTGVYVSIDSHASVLTFNLALLQGHGGSFTHFDIENI